MSFSTFACMRVAFPKRFKSFAFVSELINSNKLRRLYKSSFAKWREIEYCEMNVCWSATLCVCVPFRWS